MLHQQKGCSFFQVNICDEETLRTVIFNEQPDAIIHLAAETHVDRSIDGPDDFIESNIVGTYRLLKVSLDYFSSLDDEKKAEFRFLHVSTDEVFGSLGPDDPAFNEQSRYLPNSPYSASKAASDHLARAWFETYNFPTIITNCSNNYGPWQFPDKLIPLVIMKAVHKEAIPVYGDGENVRDWLHVRDHAAALLQVLESGEAGSTYNIGGNSESSNIGLVKNICEILDQQLPISENPRVSEDQKSSTVKTYAELITFVDDRPGHDFRYAMDISKINRDLNWRPRYDLQQGLQNTVLWYLKNQDWLKNVLDGNYQLERLGLKQ